MRKYAPALSQVHAALCGCRRILMQVDPREHSALLQSARHCLRSFKSQMKLLAGKCALEIRPHVRWDKGSALQYIQQKAGPFDTCICLGDHRADEPMFRSSESRLSIRVGDARFVRARFTLPDPAAVAVLLTIVVDICGSDARPHHISDFSSLCTWPRSDVLRF